MFAATRFGFFSGGLVPRLTNQSLTEFALGTPPGGASSSASYGLLNNGQVQLIGSPNTGTVNLTDQWLLGGGSGAGFEVRATLNSGSLNAGVTGTWQALSTSRSWLAAASRTSLGVQSQSANLTIEIRPVGGSVQATCTVDLNASVEVSN
jgi:hypothetical protein